MRLTYKYEYCSGYGSIKVKNLPPDPLINKLPYLENIWEEERNKLGQLEDLEETFAADFGIPLIILNFKTPIYVKNAVTKKIVKTTLAGVDLLGRTISVYEEGNRNNWYDKILFSNYGFTWALTIEELL